MSDNNICLIFLILYIFSLINKWVNIYWVEIVMLSGVWKPLTRRLCRDETFARFLVFDWKAAK